MSCAKLQSAPPLPPGCEGAGKPHVDELFEHRWRKAYEVRALERESRHATSQASSQCGSGASSRSASPGKARPSGAASCATGAATAAADALAAVSLADCGGRAEQGKQASTATGGQQQQEGQQPVLRQQEIVDDDEVESAVGGCCPSECSAATPAASGASQQTAGQAGGAGLLSEEEEDDETEPEIKLVWDSSSRRPGAAGGMPAVSADALGPAAAAAAQLKEQGNQLLKKGDCVAAVKCYTQALAALRAAGQQGSGAAGQASEAAAGAGATAAAGAAPAAAPAAPAPGPEVQLEATLHSNRARALLRLRRNEEAAADALQAHRLLPSWPKPLHRLAQSQVALGRWEEAVATCKKGHGLSSQSSEGRSEFTPLWDAVAVAAARAGSLAGYDGMQLEVRSAGEEAWLCQAAPHVPELDGPEEEDSHGVVTTLPALPDRAGGGATAGSGGNGSAAAAHSGALVARSAGQSAATAVDPLVAWDYRQVAAAAAAARRRTSFRSVKEAVTAARDGDRIVLRRGIHNGMGECITLDKRLLIEGEGQLGEASIDQRANVPTFRVLRGGVVLRNLDLDHTGFREALLVDGPASVAPLIQGCNIKCSGDDAINISGEAAPTFVRCTITGKKVGLHAYGSSAPRLEACAIEKCGAQGVRAQESATPALLGCMIAECEEDGAVGMDSTRLTLHSCLIKGCKGPGVDLSDSARATVTGGTTIAACVGGVWAWDRSRAVLSGATVAGGPSHALLVDGAAAVEVQGCTVQGLVHATDSAWQGILHPSNRLLDPECPTDFPPEEGPFVFEPNRYTRKQ